MDVSGGIVNAALQRGWGKRSLVEEPVDRYPYAARKVRSYPDGPLFRYEIPRRLLREVQYGIVFDENNRLLTSSDLARGVEIQRETWEMTYIFVACVYKNSVYRPGTNLVILTSNVTSPFECSVYWRVLTEEASGAGFHQPAHNAMAPSSGPALQWGPKPHNFFLLAEGSGTDEYSGRGVRFNRVVFRGSISMNPFYPFDTSGDVIPAPAIVVDNTMSEVLIRIIVFIDSKSNMETGGALTSWTCDYPTSITSVVTFGSFETLFKNINDMHSGWNEAEASSRVIVLYDTVHKLGIMGGVSPEIPPAFSPGNFPSAMIPLFFQIDLQGIIVRYAQPFGYGYRVPDKGLYVAFCPYLPMNQNITELSEGALSENGLPITLRLNAEMYYDEL